MFCIASEDNNKNEQERKQEQSDMRQNITGFKFY